jgi:hypothetical protein
MLPTIPFIKPKLQPISTYDEERQIIRLIKENRVWEFIELVHSLRDNGPVEDFPVFRGKNIHPVSTRTAVNEGKIYGSPNSEPLKYKRTLLLLDGGTSMRDPWSVWDQIDKDQLATFLATAFLWSERSSVAFNYRMDSPGNPKRHQFDSVAFKEDLDFLLVGTQLVIPEQLVILGDFQDHTVEAETAFIDTLESFALAGIQIIVINLGEKEREDRFQRLMDQENLQFYSLSQTGDLSRMVHSLANRI